MNALQYIEIKEKTGLCFLKHLFFFNYYTKIQDMKLFKLNINILSFQTAVEYQTTTDLKILISKFKFPVLIRGRRSYFNEKVDRFDRLNLEIIEK